jgi:polyketide biosynthesis acyl carrier protein
MSVEVTRDSVYLILNDCIKSVLGDLRHISFGAADRLADLGADSVSRADIVALALQRLDLEIPRTQMFGPKNIGELAELLYEKKLGG